MNLLALDTATPTCSVALWVDGQIAAELVDESGETHSRHLMAMVAQAVAATLGSVAAVDGFAVTRGPGSFTGLRIGISAAKGLAAATGRPLVGLSTLRVLAAQADRDELTVCPMLDARRNEVYAAAFQRRGGRLERLLPDEAAKPEAALAASEGPRLLIGPGALLYKDRLVGALGADARFAGPACHALRASTLARLAAGVFDAEAGPPEALMPAYIRPSYADRKRWKG